MLAMLPAYRWASLPMRAEKICHSAPDRLGLTAVASITPCECVQVILPG